MALRGPFRTRAIKGPGVETNDIAQLLKEKQISLPGVRTCRKLSAVCKNWQLSFYQSICAKRGEID